MSRCRTSLILLALGATAALTPALPATADASDPALPLGSPDLVETRTATSLARGVTWTRIVRGDRPAPEDEIGTTTRGPWVVNTVEIDPRKAKGRLEATYGPDLARTETVSDLVGFRRGLIGANASFFTYTANKAYPGDPVGLGIYRGQLRSEPTGEAKESQVRFNARTGAMTFGTVDWSARAIERRTGAGLSVDAVEHPPAVPEECATTATCTLPGETTWITPEFGSRTPSGAGAEVVLDRRGCVQRTSERSRGTALAPDQVAVQATGSDASALLAVTARRGCFTLKEQLTDRSGRRVPLSKSTFGVNGRYALTADDQVVVPDPPAGDSFFDRHPRTIMGRTADGSVVIATIDGRMTTSVGTTLAETAALAQSLGLVDSINLDGGGSTTLATASGPLNTPSGADGTQRPVGDALVWVPARR